VDYCRGHGPRVKNQNRKDDPGLLGFSHSWPVRSLRFPRQWGAERTKAARRLEATLVHRIERVKSEPKQVAIALAKSVAGSDKDGGTTAAQRGGGTRVW
jgi:hypothetical protein